MKTCWRRLFWGNVRKIGLWSNKIKQMQKQNTEDT
jgi:hypothetical protein